MHQSYKVVSAADAPIEYWLHNAAFATRTLAAAVRSRNGSCDTDLGANDRPPPGPRSERVLRQPSAWVPCRSMDIRQHCSAYERRPLGSRALRIVSRA